MPGWKKGRFRCHVLENPFFTENVSRKVIRHPNLVVITINNQYVVYRIHRLA